MNPLAVLGENLEDLLHTHVLHKTLQNLVLEVDLGDLDDVAAATNAPPAPPAQEPTTVALLHKTRQDSVLEIDLDDVAAATNAPPAVPWGSWAPPCT